MKLSGKVALITGASRGIGKSVAEAFAQEGARLFLVGHTDGEALGQTLAGIGQSGTEAEGGLFDVGSYADVKRIADAIDRRYGTLDIVINNAGNISPTPLLEITPDQWEKTVRTHLHGTFYCTVEMVRRFLKPKRSGKIVKIHRALRGQRLLWLGRLRVGKGGHHRVYQERSARTASAQHSGQCRAACGTQPND